MIEMEVKRTGYGHNVANTLGYVGGTRSPAHYNTHGIKHRDLAVTGVGVRTDTLQHTKKDFARDEKYNHYKIKTVNYVLSPKKGSVDPHNPLEVQSFLEYAAAVTKTAFPGHDAYIGIQADNKNMITHAHIIVAYTGNSIHHKRLSNVQEDYQYLRKAVRYVSSQPYFKRDPELHIDAPTSEKRQADKQPSYNQAELLRHLKPFLDEVEVGKIRSNNVGAALKKYHLSIRPYKAKRYVRDENGHIMYHKYKNGHYRMRKNRRGRRVKEPIYKYVMAGISYRYIPPKAERKPNHKYNYFSAYSLSRYDKRCSYKWFVGHCSRNQHLLPELRHDAAVDEKKTMPLTTIGLRNRTAARKDDIPPKSLHMLAIWYPVPADRNAIRQLIPVYYPANKKRQQQAKRHTYIITAPKTHLSYLAKNVRMFLANYRHELTTKVKKKYHDFKDFKDRVTVALNRGFHDLMDKAKQYIPDSFKKKFSNYVHLSPGVTLITKKYDSEAKAARKRIKVNGDVDVGFTPNGSHMSLSRLQRIVHNYKIGEIRTKREEQREHRDAIRTKRKIQQTKRDIAKNNRELQNQNQPNRNHIHHDGPTLGG